MNRDVFIHLSHNFSFLANKLNEPYKDIDSIWTCLL